MDLEIIHYDLEEWENHLASKCTLFTTKDTSFIPTNKILKNTNIFEVLRYYDQLGPEFSNNLHDMLIFDALIYNEDRHFGNFGLLRDNLTGEILKTTPIFDNGMSLFNYALPKDYSNLNKFSEDLISPYGGLTFESTCQALLNERQIEKLKKITNFSFQKHAQYNLPNQHLEAIENKLRERAKELIKLKITKKPKRENKITLHKTMTREALLMEYDCMDTYGKLMIKQDFPFQTKKEIDFNIYWDADTTLKALHFGAYLNLNPREHLDDWEPFYFTNFVGGPLEIRTSNTDNKILEYPFLLYLYPDNPPKKTENELIVSLRENEYKQIISSGYTRGNKIEIINTSNNSKINQISTYELLLSPLRPLIIITSQDTNKKTIITQAQKEEPKSSKSKTSNQNTISPND